MTSRECGQIFVFDARSGSVNNYVTPQEEVDLIRPLMTSCHVFVAKCPREVTDKASLKVQQSCNKKSCAHVMSTNSKEARRRHHSEVLITISSYAMLGGRHLRVARDENERNVDHAAAAQVKDKCNVTYLSQISFGMITSSLSSHLFVAGLSWLIRFKLLERYLKMVSSSDGLSPSRNSCSLRRIRWLQIIVCLVSAQ